MRIEDGTGSGKEAGVSDQNRLKTIAVTESEGEHAAEEGRAFNLNTGLISVTGDATLIYIKNNEDQPFFVEAIALGSFEGINHSDDPYITVSANDTGGDLITDATAVDMNQNRNFGSKATLVADVYKGKVGGTITGGSDVAILQATPGGRSYYGINMMLPRGSTLAVNLTANVSSGSANWYCALIGFVKENTTD